MPSKKEETLINITEDELADLAIEIVSKIVIDINKRAGFGASFRMVDNLTKKGMLDRWHWLTRDSIDNFK